MAVLEVSINYNNPSLDQFCMDYWGSEFERKGFFHLAWNAGACRLLVPKKQESHIKDMLTAKSAIITRGFSTLLMRDVMEVLFDDESEAPFAVNLDHEQCTQLLPNSEIGVEFQLNVWTYKGSVASFECEYSRVSVLQSMYPIPPEITRIRRER